MVEHPLGPYLQRQGRGLKVAALRAVAGGVCPVVSGDVAPADCQTRSRASARADQIAVRAFGPAVARVSMRRETVESEATGSNTAGSARSVPTSARQSPPSATARATSSTTRVQADSHIISDFC